MIFGQHPEYARDKMIESYDIEAREREERERKEQEKPEESPEPVPDTSQNPPDFSPG